LHSLRKQFIRTVVVRYIVDNQNACGVFIQQNGWWSYNGNPEAGFAGNEYKTCDK